MVARIDSRPCRRTNRRKGNFLLILRVRSEKRKGRLVAKPRKNGGKGYTRK